MIATDISRDKPSLALKASLKAMMAPPTVRSVMVWPTPHTAPIPAALITDLSRLTIVVTATMWSGSVA